MDSSQANLDFMYYRNKATQQKMVKHSPYQTMGTYNSCSQTQVNNTAVPTYTNYSYTPGQAVSTTVPTGTPTSIPTTIPPSTS